jgi:hypothetical protein
MQRLAAGALAAGPAAFFAAGAEDGWVGGWVGLHSSAACSAR